MAILPLHVTPAVIAAFFDSVHFLVIRAAYIPYPKLARLPVHADAPWVAKAVGPNFGPGAVLGLDKRIVRRDGIGPAVFTAVHIDSQDLAQEAGAVLARIV